MLPLEFGFSLEPIFHFMARLKAALEGSKVGEFCNQGLARPDWRGRDEPQRIKRRWAVDCHVSEIPFRTGRSGDLQYYLSHMTGARIPKAAAVAGVYDSIVIYMWTNKDVLVTIRPW